MQFRSPTLIRGLVFLLCLGSFVPFQNCSKVKVSDATDLSSATTAAAPTVPDPSPSPSPSPSGHPQILISANPLIVAEGSNTTLTITFNDIEGSSYLCTDRVSHEIIASGSIARSGQTVRVPVDRDLHCEAMGHPVGSQTSLSSSAEISVDCANRIKNTAKNTCEDFSCKKVIELSVNDLLNIPERTSEGICYAAKIMSAITNSKSSLTSVLDNEVLSRNHDTGSGQRNPYQMGLAQTEVRINGPRVVKLSGGLNPTQKILVDNFILMGIYPADKDISQSLSSVYQVMGTSDSSIYDSTGKDTHSISFRNVLLPIVSFGVGGTSSVTAVDVTRSIQPQVIQKLDVRALDCGGARELSDVYILFQ